MRRRGEQAGGDPSALGGARQVDELCQALNRRSTAELSRQALLEEFEPLCLKIVDGLIRRFQLPRQLHEDMMAQARLGLLEAWERFDQDKGARLATFAYYRIQGAVVDGLRAGGQLKRRSRSQAALASKSAQMQAHPTWTANSSQGGWTEKVAQVDATVRHHGIGWLLVQEAEARQEAQVGRLSPSRQLLEAEQRQHLREALETLSQQERLCIEEHYFKDSRYQEIAEQLGCSPSWVSRCIKRGLDKLYKRMHQRHYTKPG